MKKKKIHRNLKIPPGELITVLIKNGYDISKD